MNHSKLDLLKQKQNGRLASHEKKNQQSFPSTASYQHRHWWISVPVFLIKLQEHQKDLGWTKKPHSWLAEREWRSFTHRGPFPVENQRCENTLQLSACFFFFFSKIISCLSLSWLPPLSASQSVSLFYSHKLMSIFVYFLHLPSDIPPALTLSSSPSVYFPCFSPFCRRCISLKPRCVHPLLQW